MGKTLITRKELCERWGLSYNTICNYESNGTLTRNPNFESPMYYVEEIIKIESLSEPNPLSPMERRSLENKVRDLKRMVDLLQEQLTKYTMINTESVSLLSIVQKHIK